MKEQKGTQKEEHKGTQGEELKGAQRGELKGRTLKNSKEGTFLVYSSFSSLNILGLFEYPSLNILDPYQVLKSLREERSPLTASNRL